MSAPVTADFVEPIVAASADKLRTALANFLPTATCQVCGKEFDGTGGIYNFVFPLGGLAWKCASCEEAGRIRDDAVASLPKILTDLRDKGVKLGEIQAEINRTF